MKEGKKKLGEPKHSSFRVQVYREFKNNLK